MDTNSLESEYLFAEKKLATVLSSIIFSLALFSNIKKLSIPFFAFERQLFQRSEPLADISKRFVLSANMIGFSTFEVWCKSFTYSSFCMAVGWGCR